MQYIKLDHAESCGGQTEDEESSRYLSHACVCAARGRVIALSVCQSVSGHINEHIEQIRNACSFFLQCISNKWKNNLNTPHKQESYDELSKLLNKSHLDFNIPTIIYRSTFIPNKAQPASSVSANSTSNGISALLGTSWVLYTNYHSSQYNYTATISTTDHKSSPFAWSAWQGWQVVSGSAGGEGNHVASEDQPEPPSSE